MHQEKKLAVSFGSFACVVEGYDHPFPILLRVVKHFRDLADKDPSFGNFDTLDDVSALQETIENLGADPIEVEAMPGGVYIRKLVPPTAVAVPAAAPVAEDVEEAPAAVFDSPAEEELPQDAGEGDAAMEGPGAVDDYAPAAGEANLSAEDEDRKLRELVALMAVEDTDTDAAAPELDTRTYVDEAFEPLPSLTDDAHAPEVETEVDDEPADEPSPVVAAQTAVLGAGAETDDDNSRVDLAEAEAEDEVAPVDMFEHDEDEGTDGDDGSATPADLDLTDEDTIDDTDALTDLAAIDGPTADDLEEDGPAQAIVDDPAPDEPIETIDEPPALDPAAQDATVDEDPETDESQQAPVAAEDAESADAEDEGAGEGAGEETDVEEELGEEDDVDSAIAAALNRADVLELRQSAAIEAEDTFTKKGPEPLRLMPVAKVPSEDAPEEPAPSFIDSVAKKTDAPALFRISQPDTPEAVPTNHATPPPAATRATDEASAPDPQSGSKALGGFAALGVGRLLRRKGGSDETTAPWDLKAEKPSSTPDETEIEAQPKPERVNRLRVIHSDTPDNTPQDTAASPAAHETPAPRPEPAAPAAAAEAPPRKASGERGRKAEGPSIKDRLHASFSQGSEPAATAAFDLGGESEDEDDYSARGFARRSGAKTLPELMGAAAAFLVLVEGRATMSRNDIMEMVKDLAGSTPLTAEAKIKAFGKLVRSGDLVRSDGGQFAMSENALARIRAHFEDDDDTPQDEAAV